MIRKIERFIIQHNMIESGDTVVVGVSGGADSVCLLLVLNELKEKMHFTIKAVHVNHMIRGEEAARDEVYVQDLCQKLDIELYCVHANIPQMAIDSGKSLELVGREVRYKAFSSVEGMTKIAVAHHANDQAETVLFHMARGTSLRGMGGMKPVRDKVIRPLLCVNRECIEGYLQEKGVIYCTDSTNLSNDYARNRIRNQVLLQLTDGVNKEAVANINELAEELREVYDFIYDTAQQIYKQAAMHSAGQVRLEVISLKNQPACIVREVIMLAIQNVVDTCKNITRKHIEQVYGLIGAPVSTRTDLIHGLCVEREYDYIHFFISAKNKPVEGEPEDKTNAFGMYYGNQEQFVCPSENITFQIQEFDGNWENLSNDYTKVVDYDKIKDNLSIRKRLPGDYIILDDSGSKKSLKTFFIDKKIPQKDRDNIWLVADGNHVVWIVGQRISNYYKTNENTKRALLIKVRRYEDGISDRTSD